MHVYMDEKLHGNGDNLDRQQYLWGNFGLYFPQDYMGHLNHHTPICFQRTPELHNRQRYSKYKKNI